LRFARVAPIYLHASVVQALAAGIVDTESVRES
jgi:hypothetical protein